MAESHVQTPLLTQNHHTQNHHAQNSSNYRPHLSLSIDSDQKACNHSHENPQFELENPFEFLGVDGFSMPPSSTADPFRNHTPGIEGIYEFVKIVICLPIAAVRLVLFGLGLFIGYLATLIALRGWKDRNNPMPRWGCWFMWITRFCARCILFSFGYHWIKRKGQPAPREIAPIVVSNHVSYIEPIFFFYELFPTIVASESHDSLPVVGTIIRAMQVIYVNRFSPSSRKNAVNEIKIHGEADLSLFGK